MNVAIHPAEPSSELDGALALARIDAVGIEEHQLDKLEALDSFEVLVLELADEPLRRVRLGRRVAEDSGIPILLVAGVDQLPLIADETFYSDLVTAPPHPIELQVRLHRLTRSESEEDVLAFDDLLINLATYQVTIAGKPVDMTYMEYQLLTFFVENRGRVWSREQLLSKVWGYDYYGGARTVDVHVRRLRSKIGEERSHWITTVRSVGYRFG